MRRRAEEEVEMDGFDDGEKISEERPLNSVGIGGLSAGGDR